MNWFKKCMWIAYIAAAVILIILDLVIEMSKVA